MTTEKSGIDDLLSEHAGATGVPTPAKAGLSAAFIDRWLLTRVLPILGCVMFPSGLLALRSVDGSSRLVSLLGVAGGLATIAVLLLADSLRSRARGHYAGAALASLWIAASTFEHAPVRSFASVVVALVSIAMLWGRVVHPRAGWLWLLFLLFPLQDAGDDVTYQTVTFLTTACSFAVFHGLGKRSLAAWAVSLVVGQALVYAGQPEVGPLALASVMVGLPSALFAQHHLRPSEVSTLRMFVGECVVAAALGAIVSLTGVDWAFSDSMWTWVALVACFEALCAVLERSLPGYRIGIVCTAFNLGVVSKSLDWPWHTILFSLLVTAAALRIHASVRRDRFASQLASANVWVAVASVSTITVRDAASPSVFLLGFAASQALLLSVRDIQAAATLPAWRGFLERRHVVLIRGYTLQTLRMLARLKAVALFIGWFSVPLVWLRHLRARLFPVGFDYVSYASGHALGVWMFTTQGVELLTWHSGLAGDAQLRAMLPALLGCGYAVIVGRLGARHVLPYGRFAGAACAAFPAIRTCVDSTPIDMYGLGMLLIFTGAAFAIIAMKNKRELPRPAMSN